MARKIHATLLLVAAAVGCGEPDPPEAARASTPSAVATADVSAGQDARPRILIVGTSLTAGLGVGADDAYPAVLQRMLDSAGFAYRVVNAGVSGETSAGGVRRIGWLLRQPVAVLVLELGANDGLRGLSIDALASNLQTIIDETRAAHPEARIFVAGMEAPPNLGRQYTDAFRAVFGEVARRNDAVFIPFILDGVAAVEELNQDDMIHPTAEGHRRIAANVWDVLAPTLIPAGEETP